MQKLKDDEFANALRIAEKLVKPESDYPIKKQKKHQLSTTQLILLAWLLSFLIIIYL